MFLYKLASKVYLGYYEYDAAVVAAETEDAARRTHPCEDAQGSRYRWNDNMGAWVNTAAGSNGDHPYVWPAPQDLICIRLGIADEGVSAGVVLSSFIAG